MRAFPFDSQITGYDEGGIPQYDRASNSEELARLLSSFLCDGVFGQGMCAVTAGSGMKASIATGCCIIQGRYGYLETAHEVTFDEASTANPRIDTVVLRRDLSGNVRNIVCSVVKGTAAASPIPPALTRDGTVWELGLANVLIPKNASGILQTNITDTRLDTERCGIVFAIRTDVDTTSLFAQLQSELAAVYMEVEKVNIMEKTATLTANGWSASAPYTQTVSVEGILGADSPFVDLDTTNATAETYADLSAAWASIGRAVSSAGALTFYCYENTPEMNIPIKIKVVR